MIRILGIFILGLQFGVAAETVGLQAPRPVEIVVYSDFQCPFCRQFAQPIRDLMGKGVEGVPTKVVFKTFPLTFHPQAKIAAQAAIAAGEQGKFWEMHDLLFANQSALKRDDLLKYAKELKLDFERFGKDLDSDRVKKEVETEQAEGAKRGVNGTPTFYINGAEFSGARSFDQLKQLVQKEHWRAQAMSEINDTMMSRGPIGAPITLEFFADLESPVSRSAMPVLEEVMQRYPSSVRL